MKRANPWLGPAAAVITFLLGLASPTAARGVVFVGVEFAGAAAGRFEDDVKLVRDLKRPCQDEPMFTPGSRRSTTAGLCSGG